MSLESDVEYVLDHLGIKYELVVTDDDGCEWDFSGTRVIMYRIHDPSYNIFIMRSGHDSGVWYDYLDLMEVLNEIS